MKTEQVKEYKIYFIPANNDASYLIDEQATEVTFQFNSDFIALNKSRTKWSFMIDIEIIMEHIGSLLHRTEFELKLRFTEMNDKKIILELVDDAARRAVFCFKEHCRMEGLESVPFTEIDEEMKGRIADSFLRQLPVRETAWKHNIELHQEVGASFSPGRKTGLFLRGTFVVMDQLLMLNPNCDIENNRMQLFNAIGLDMSTYNTLKIYTNQISDKVVALSMFQITYLFLLVDCAAQILVSPLGDMLQEGLESHGLKPELLHDYLTASTEIRAQLNDTMKKNGTTIDLLIKTFDWVSMMS